MTNRNTGGNQERTDHGDAARSNPSAGSQQSGQPQGMQSDDNDYGNLDGDNQGRRKGQNEADNGVGGFGQEKRQPTTSADAFDDEESLDEDENGESASAQRRSL
jgi:hypothetical protein